MPHIFHPTQRLGGRPRKVRYGLHNYRIAKQISMTKPNTPKICQVDKLPNKVPFHFSDFLKDPQAQHRPNTGPTPLVTPKSRPPSISLYLAPEAPPCRAPGLCSFLADEVAPQVDVCQCFVDLQRFGEGLWPKRWQTGDLQGH